MKISKIQKLTSASIGTYPAIHQAVIRGEVKKVQRILARGEDPSRPAKRCLCYSPLHLCAAYWPRKEIAQMLLDAGADIEAREFNMRSPLHVAVAGYSADAVQWFVNHGADVDAEWFDGSHYLPRTPLQVAVVKMSAPIVEILLRAGAKTEFCILPWPAGGRHSTSGGIPVGVCQYICHTCSMLPGIRDELLDVVRQAREEEFLDWWAAGQPGPQLIP